MLAQFGQSLLVQWFRELFTAANALVREEASAALPPDHLQRRLVMHIEQCDRQAARLGGSFLEAYGDVRYAMVAIADELLITSVWRHSQWWQQNLLEEAVHGTYVAGEEFFRRAERIVSTRRSSEYIEAAKVYLLCLLLGFQGKYRGASSGAERQQLAVQLYQYIFDRPPIEGMLAVPLSSTDELHVYPATEMTYFAPWYRRYLMLLGIVGIAVLASVVVWLVLTAPLRRIASEIESTPTPILAPLESTQPHHTSPELALIVNASGPVTVRLYDRLSGDLVADTTIPLHREGRIQLPQYRQLTLLCEAPGCYPVLDTLTTEDTTLLSRNYALKQLATLLEQPIVLEHVSFDAGSAELAIRSVPWLDALARALVSDTSLHVTIYGHTDAVGNPQQNMRLSRQRAEQVVTYLLQRGIAYERMKAIGKGAQQPRAPNTTPEGRALNRRVELVLTRR